MSAVPLYIYIPVVLGLLATHGVTVYWAQRRIRELKGALDVRRELLDESHVTTMIAKAVGRAKENKLTLRAGEKLTVQSDDCQIHIEASDPVRLKVKAVKFV